MFGYHCSLTADTKLTTMVKQHAEVGVNCVQCYIGGNQTYKRRIFDVNDLAATKTYIAENNFRLYTHSCLCMNLASGSMTNVACLNDELKMVLATGASTVVHIGSKNVQKQPTGTLDNVIASVKALGVKERTSGQRWPVLLENAAGEGAKFGSSLDDLEYLFAALVGQGVGLCYDTCHGYSAGIFDLSTEEVILDFFEVIDDTVGVGKLQLLHVNDSKTKFSGKSDRHENLGRGHIWGSDVAPLKFLIKECQRRGIDMVLETPDPITDYNLVQSWDLL